MLVDFCLWIIWLEKVFCYCVNEFGKKWFYKLLSIKCLKIVYSVCIYLLVIYCNVEIVLVLIWEFGMVLLGE